MIFIQQAHAVSKATCAAQGFLDTINQAVLYPLILLLTAVAFLVFLWGGFRFIMNAEDSPAHETGRKHMIWGIIGLLVMVSAFAILNIAANTFGLGLPPDCGRAAPGAFPDPAAPGGGAIYAPGRDEPAGER